MFDALIRGSLRHVWLVLGAALLILGFGLVAANRMPIDVLPDLSAPSVTVVTETGGLAPEEAERLVTLPIEQALGVSFLPGSIYLISRMPSDPQMNDVLPIGIISLLLAFAATLYPSWRASRVNPAEALRYE